MVKVFKGKIKLLLSEKRQDLKTSTSADEKQQDVVKVL